MNKKQLKCKNKNLLNLFIIVLMKQLKKIKNKLKVLKKSKKVSQKMQFS